MAAGLGMVMRMDARLNQLKIAAYFIRGGLTVDDIEQSLPSGWRVQSALQS